MRAPIFAVLLLALAGPAWGGDAAARPDPIDVRYEACTARDPSTAGMISCAADAEQAWDRELNAAYGALVAVLEGRAREALREAQRAWIAQRDREHALQTSIRALLEGTMWGPVMADQRVSLVKARTLQLRAYKSLLDDGRP